MRDPIRQLNDAERPLRDLLIGYFTLALLLVFALLVGAFVEVIVL